MTKKIYFFYFLLFALVASHSNFAFSQQPFGQRPQVPVTLYLSGTNPGGSCEPEELYTPDELLGCLTERNKNDELCKAPELSLVSDTTVSARYKVQQYRYGEPKDCDDTGWTETRIGWEGETTYSYGSCDDLSESTGFDYVPSNHPGWDCELDSDGDGIGDWEESTSVGRYDADGVEDCGGDYAYFDGDSCSILPPLGLNEFSALDHCSGYADQNGSAWDCSSYNYEDEVFQCYDGTSTASPNDCPEYTGDPDSSPYAEPNGVCESGNYSQFSTDTDCQAPSPSPCTGDCGDGIDPSSDHDNDGIPNQSDPDADVDGDGVANGVDPDWTGGTGTGDSGDGTGSGDDGTGSTGSHSNSCDNVPACSDNSVECAILKQEWTHMCYDQEGVEAAASNSCGQRPKCNGDGAECAILLQQFYNACEFPEWEGENTDDEPSSMFGEGFYESEYQDGFEGIWEERKAALEQTEMIGWLNSFQFADSGQCPIFTFELWIIGAVTIPDTFCYLFDIIRAIFILSAIFYARRIVFGG